VKLDRLPLRAEDGSFNAVVETPRGDRTKFAYDPETHLFRAKKLLPLGLAFPFPFGFLPSTKGGDGDPLDVLLITDADLPIGTLVRIRLIGVIEAEQGVDQGHMARNDRLLGVPMLEHQDRPPEALSDIPDSELSEIETFFAAYQKANGKLFVVLRRSDAKAAKQLVEKAVTAA
jgi:inorganic pyrophosphatase